MSETDRTLSPTVPPIAKPARPAPQMIDWAANIGMVLLVGILILIAIVTIVIFAFMFPWHGSR